MILHTRSEVWPGAIPKNTNGTTRPLLAKPLHILTVHHTGAGRFMDRGDTPAELRAIQNYAAGAGKPWEYNYVLDSAGESWEYAGAYQAAHSAGENHTAIGVLLLGNFTVETLTPEMVKGFRWLRWVLTSFGHLAPTAWVIPHKDMPGASTVCPGPNVLSQWSSLLVPWT